MQPSPMKIPVFRTLLLAGICAVAVCGPARADDSAMNEGAYGPEPRGGTAGTESIIRMESEQITVRFGKKTSEVTARFVFRSYKPKEPRAPARRLPRHRRGVQGSGATRPEGRGPVAAARKRHPANCKTCARSSMARRSNPSWTTASCK